MKRSGAIWVVLVVIAAAALLMYFVVMPQVRGNKTMDELARKAEETVQGAKNAVNDAGKQVEQAAQSGDQAKAAMFAKMSRLKADTATATSELQALYAKGTPSAAEVAAAKAKIEAALKTASEMKLPEGVDAATSALAAKASEGAKDALATLEKLPADANQAKAAIADLNTKMASAFMTVTPDKPADAADAKQPETGQDVAKLDNTDAAKVVEDAKVVTPSFDILRVEKDGSTVIAGRTDPGAKIEVVDAGKVIASAQADDTGAFAAVLDNPLSSGDHSIVLKSTAKDGKSTTSEEVATVSVPKDASGELLAMVTRPGEASRILTMPEIDKTVDVAKVEDAAKPADGTIAIPDLPASSMDLAANPPVVGTETADQTTARVEDTAKPADTATAPEVLVSAVEIEGDKIFIAGNARPNATVRVYADDKLVAEVKADENGRFVADNTMPLIVGNHTIRADVLSTDGAKVDFRASVPFFRPEGNQFTVAASDDTARKTEDATRKTVAEPLSDGTLNKARDEAGKALGLLKNLYADGKTPTAEELAAARSSTEIALKTLSEVHVADNSDPALIEMASKASKDAANALAKLKAVPIDATAVKSALGNIEKDVNSALKPATVAAADDTAAKTVPEDGSVAAETQVNPGSTDPKDAAKAEDKSAEPVDDSARDTSNDAATTDVSKTADGASSTEEKDPSMGNAAANTSGQDTAKTTGEKTGSQDTATSDQPKVIEQAPLTQSEGSVIIRRGDTLWHISRRVYGKGVRYTTIYMANQAQISNPDRIMPGQIFGVPVKPLDNAEALHKERLTHHKK